jgi:Mce-associated membrane protein
MSDQSARGRKRIAGRRPDRRTPGSGRPTAPSSGTPNTAPEATTAAGTPEETGTTLVEAEPYGQVAAGGDGGRRAQILAAVLAALLVATLAVGGVLGQKAWSNHEEEQGRDAAAGAAAKAAGLVLSYDYRRLDQDFAAARQTLTPDLAAKFDQTTNLVGEQATKTKPTVKAEVREVSVTNSSADLVNVLLFVNQTTTAPSRRASRASTWTARASPWSAATAPGWSRK